MPANKKIHPIKVSPFGCAVIVPLAINQCVQNNYDDQIFIEMRLVVMTSRKRESGYLVLIIALMAMQLAYPVTLVHDSKSIQPVGIYAFVAGITVGLIMEMGLRLLFHDNLPSIHVYHPSNKESYNLDKSLKDALEQVLERLEELHFQVFIDADEQRGTEIRFWRSKRLHVFLFGHNGFVGKIHLSSTFTGSRITCQITMLDRLLFDTGELSRLKNLCRYIALDAPELQTPVEFPGMLTLGLNMIILALMPWYLLGQEWFTMLNHFLFATAVLGGFVCLGSVFMLIWFHRQTIGLLLALLGLTAVYQLLS